MSGHGGSGLGGGGGFNPGDCASLFVKTTLNSPNPVVIATLKKGDTLEVVLGDKNARQVLAMTATGTTAGSITFGSLATLASCMNEGNEYVAVVQSIDGGACEVEVRPKAKS